MRKSKKSLFLFLLMAVMVFSCCVTASAATKQKASVSKKYYSIANVTKIYGKDYVLPLGNGVKGVKMVDSYYNIPQYTYNSTFQKNLQAFLNANNVKLTEKMWKTVYGCNFDVVKHTNQKRVTKTSDFKNVEATFTLSDLNKDGKYDTLTVLTTGRTYSNYSTPVMSTTGRYSVTAGKANFQFAAATTPSKATSTTGVTGTAVKLSLPKDNVSKSFNASAKVTSVSKTPKATFAFTSTFKSDLQKFCTANGVKLKTTMPSSVTSNNYLMKKGVGLKALTKTSDIKTVTSKATLKDNNKDGVYDTLVIETRGYAKDSSYAVSSIWNTSTYSVVKK